MTSMTLERTSALNELIESVRRTVRQELPPQPTGTQVAAALEPFLGRDDLLTQEQRQPDPDNYVQHVLHVEDDGSFSIVSLVWLPHQETPIHDHVSWCVVGVHAGEETEYRYDVHVAEEDRWLSEEETSVNHHLSVCAVVPPGDIHKVVNSGTGTAISIHVYGADISRLGSSIRRRYDMPIRGGAS